MPRPNILYLHSHDTGRYIQPYGHAVSTPRLQRLAEEGVLFRRNFCVNPTCSPSRASLLTGCYPHENGMLGLAHRGFALHDYGRHLLHTLRGAGYRAVLAGVQHIARNRDDRAAWQVIGYDDFLGEPDRADRLAADFLARSPREPFFLSVGFHETHRVFPGLDDAPDDPRYTLPPSPLPDTAATRADMTRFKAGARALDRKFGTVLDALTQGGLAANTIVICTTDHGIAFPRMKCTLHDTGIGTMLIMRGPGGFSGGGVVDAMTSHLDIFPTLCDLLEIAAPPWLRGASLLPLVQKKSPAIHDELFFEVNFHAAYEPMRAVRTKRWKYIRRFDGRKRPVLPNCDDGESKTVWLAHGWKESSVPEESLFDLMFDPNEMDNRATDNTCRAVLRDMRARLGRWMEETDDPLLKGNLQAPEGAVVNDPDDISPEGELKKTD